jgi:hypothetical protein
MAKKNKFFGDAADEIARLNKEMAETNAILSSVAKALSENAKAAAEFTGDAAASYNESFKSSLDLSKQLQGFSQRQLNDGRTLRKYQNLINKSKSDLTKIEAKLAYLTERKVNASKKEGKLIDSSIKKLNYAKKEIEGSVEAAEDLVHEFEKLDKNNPFKSLAEFTSSVPVLKSLTKELVTANEKYKETLAQTDSKFKSLLVGTREYVKLLSKAASVFVFEQLKKGIVAIDEGAVGLSNQLMISKTEAGRLAINYAKAADANNELLQSSRDLRKAQIQLGTMLGTSAMLSYDMASSFDILVNRMGISAENAGSLAEFTAATGQNFTEFSNEIAGTVKMENALQNSAINQREIYKDIANLSSATRISMQAQGQSLAKAAFEARKLGLNLADMEKIGDSLLNFEQSIANELEAELITGKELNLERARLAFLNNDMATFTSEIAKNVGSAAEFAGMNRIAQEAIAKSFGMQRDEFADMLVSQEALKVFAKDNLHTEQEVVDEMKRRLAAGESYASLVQEYGKNELVARAQALSMQEKLNKLIEKMVDFATKYLVPVFEGIDKFLTNASSHAKLIGGGLLALAIGGPIIRGVMMIARLFRGMVGSSSMIGRNMMMGPGGGVGGAGGGGGGMTMMSGPGRASANIKSGTDKLGRKFHYNAKTGRRVSMPASSAKNLSRMSKVTKGMKGLGRGFAPLALLGAGMDVASNFSDDSLTGGEAALKSVDQNKGMITGAIIGSIVPGLGTVVGAGIGGIIDMFAPEVGTYGNDATAEALGFEGSQGLQQAIDNQTMQLTAVLRDSRTVNLNTVQLENRQSIDYRSIN